MMYATILADRMKHIRAGEITKLLKAAAGKNVLSLAGGHPALETLPVKAIQEINSYIFEKHSAHILQYDLSQGSSELRQELQSYLKERGIDADPSIIGVSSGAQNAIDAAAKVLINPGDRIAIESPTFFYSIQTFMMYGPKIVEIKSDEHGVLPEHFEQECKNGGIKFFYIIPNFQNPRGTTLPLERRKQILAVAKRYKVMLIEDDPYYELRYEGEDIAPMASMAPEQVIYVGSFSKTFSPGMRVGYYVAPKEIGDLMTAVRQVDDIHANRYAQMLVYEYLHNGYLSKNLVKTRQLYSRRLKAAADELEKHLDKADFSWQKPHGGLFIWLEGQGNFSALKAYKECAKQGVIFVPGNFFFYDFTHNDRCLRLNFTSLDEQNLRLAIQKLAAVLNDKQLTTR